MTALPLFSGWWSDAAGGGVLTAGGWCLPPAASAAMAAEIERSALVAARAEVILAVVRSLGRLSACDSRFSSHPGLRQFAHAQAPAVDG